MSRDSMSQVCDDSLQTRRSRPVTGRSVTRDCGPTTDFMVKYRILLFIRCNSYL